jgi:YVTN family beta-propeller protein
MSRQKAEGNISMAMSATVATISVSVAVFLGVASAATQAARLVLDSKIVLGWVDGRIDHLGIDLQRKRLLVAELGNNSVSVIDLAEGKVFQRITGLREPQGVAYSPRADLIYVANAGDGSVDIFNAADLTQAGRTNLESDADNIRFDGPDRMIIGYGGGALAVLDDGNGRKVGDITLAAHPESFQLDPARGRIYVNLPEAHCVAVVDRKSGEEIARWGLPDANANFAMALDADGNRLFVGYRSPAMIVVFDTRTGKSIERAMSCGDADDVFYDAKRERIYASCGEGFLAVLDASGPVLKEIARIRTQLGARTSLFVPELDRLFVAARASGSEPATVWVFRLL